MDEPVFREDQRFTQRWLWALVVVAAVAVWVFVVAQLVGSGGDEAGWVLVIVAVVVGVGLPVLFAVARLTVEVFADRVEIRFRPFVRRTIALDSVVDAEAVTYSAVREYGGWGVKGWSRRKVAYNVRGDRGVLLTLVDGRTVLLGSQRAADLEAAIGRRPGRAAPSLPND
jgi:hypothetical protein